MVSNIAHNLLHQRADHGKRLPNHLPSCVVLHSPPLQVSFLPAQPSNLAYTALQALLRFQLLGFDKKTLIHHTMISINDAWNEEDSRFSPEVLRFLPLEKTTQERKL